MIVEFAVIVEELDCSSYQWSSPRLRTSQQIVLKESVCSALLIIMQIDAGDHILE